MSMNTGCYVRCDGPGCAASSDDYPELRGTRRYDGGRLVIRLMKEHHWSVKGTAAQRMHHYDPTPEQHLCPKCKNGGTGSVIPGQP